MKYGSVVVLFEEANDKTTSLPHACGKLPAKGESGHIAT